MTMPPKNVYGKRTNRAPGAGFSKFLSPDKDELLQLKEKKTSDKAPDRTKTGTTDVFEALEKQLESLNIDGKDVPSRQKKDAPEETKHRQALGAKDQNKDVKQKRRITVETVLEKPAVDCAETVDLKVQAPDTRPEKVATEEISTKIIPDLVEEKAPKRSTKSTKSGRKEHRRTKSKSQNAPRPDVAQLLTPEPEPQDIYTTHVSPLLELTDRRSLTPFSDWSCALESHFTVSKIAEASYGEVYRLSLKSAIPGFTRADESVLKIIAIKSPPNAPLPNAPVRGSKRGNVNAETQAKMLREREDKEVSMSGIDIIRSEVQLLQHLAPIPGFTNFRDLLILQGRPSAAFANAWKAYNKARPRNQKSFFPDPSKKTSYDETQLWAVIEMQDAGMDLEKLIEEGGMGSIWEVWDVFWGVVLTVAKGEEGVRFEHRDLHLGNICIRSRIPNTPLIHPPITLSSLHQKLGFTGFETTLIDYTLSRADMTDPESALSRPTSSSSDASGAGPPEPDVAYLDLDLDPAVFEGDAEQEYQYEIYRYMRSWVYHRDPEREYTPPAPQKLNTITNLDPDCPPRSSSEKQNAKQNIWRPFYPTTNILWIHFLLHKLFEYITWPSESKPEDIMQRLNLESAAYCDFYPKKVHRKACRMEKALKVIKELVDPRVAGRENGVGSARELVAVALSERWLGEGDVV